MLSGRVDVVVCVWLVADGHQHGVLLAGAAGAAGAAAGVRAAASGGGAARQGQVLELRILQVHLCVRRAQRAVHGRGSAVVLVVHAARLPAPARAAVQRSV